MSLHARSAVAIAAAVQAGEVSAAEVLEAHIARIERFDPALNCFTATTFPRARAQAAAIDRNIAAGKPAGALAGVPIAVKNLFNIAGLPTLAGSKIERDSPPATADAPLLARLIAAGAVLLGALNMDEYAYGFVTENAHDGPTHNPHDVDRLAALTLGSDTNGSIRLPAGLCGIFGLKPGYGRLDRGGTFPFVDSFDHLGPFARSAADLALAYDLMQESEPVTPRLGQRVEGARVAVLRDWFEYGAAPEMLEAVATVANGLGATGSAILPEARRARAAAFCISAFEGGQLHKANLKTRPQDFDPATRPRLIAGALQPAETIYQAQRFRAWFREQARQLFERYDLLLAPATPCTAPLIGQKTLLIEDETLPLRPNLGLYTQPISFIGLPVVCVPITGGGLMPRGVQIIAPAGREDLALAAALQLEQNGVVAAPVAEPVL
jgi:aspartyl-tRNA(Asn)/glutamyl-tRNA(Gln) amidotransferase subunit A